jgi:rod shape-determining protein MreC
MRARQTVPGWVAIVGLLVAALLVAAPGPLRETEQLGTRLISPVQLGISRAVAGVGQFFETVNQAGDLANQNRRYREEIERLEALTVQLHEMELENRDLRQLLGLRELAPPGSLVSANVIARDPMSMVQSVVIDRGADDGVTVNHPVVSWRGVVGRVVEVHPRSSKVLLITDVNSAVSARLQDDDSRATGITRGSGDGRLVLQYVPRTDTLRTGGTLITSGIGGTFPAGLVIGKILQIRQKDVEVFQEALIEPAVDMRNLERIYVLLRTSPPDPDGQ